jgi:hypothetical protein
MPVRRPKLFKLLTSRAQRMLRKFLEPRPEKRPGGLADLAKFLEDRWLTRTSLDRQTGETNTSPTEMRLGPFFILYWVHFTTLYQLVFNNLNCLYEDTSSLFHESRKDLKMGISTFLNSVWYILYIYIKLWVSTDCVSKKN